MLLVLYSHNYLKFRLFIYIYIYLYKGHPEGQHLRRHVDYSGLEGTKGQESAIHRHFADDQLIWLNKRNVFSVSLLKTVDSRDFMRQNY